MAIPTGSAASLAETAAEHLRSNQFFLALDVARAARAQDSLALAPLLVMALALLKVGEAAEISGLLSEIDQRLVTHESRLRDAFEAFEAMQPTAADRDGDPLLRFERFAEALQALTARADRAQDLPGDPGLVDLLLQVYRESWNRFGRRRYLKQGRDLARLSYARSGHLWHGFLAAILAWQLGDHAEARRIGTGVAEATGRSSSEAPSAEPLSPGAVNAVGSRAAFFAALGCGIVALMNADTAAAEALFQRAVSASGRQLSLILEARGELAGLAAAGLAVPPALLDAFPLPVVAICAGQPLDAPGSAVPIYPEAITAAVEMAIRDEVDRLDIGIGYCRAAAGADLLLAEALLRRGAELNLWLPYRTEAFVRHHVQPAGPEWVRRFNHVMRLADTVRIVSDDRHDDGIAIGFANRVMDGAARLRAELLGVQPNFLGVWDFSLGPSPGSVSDFIDHWGDPGRLRLIHLDDIRDAQGIEGEAAADLEAVAADDDAREAGEPRRVMALLFADLIGFSKLEDHELGGFWDFVGEAHRRVCAEQVAEPFLIESWGDCFFVTIQDPLAMAAYALSLTEAFAGLDSTAFELSIKPQLRVAVHAGPVSSTRNSFTGRTIVYGKHVSRAARIEPITVPGQIYASEEFVALLTADEAAAETEAKASRRPYERRYRCEYVGRMSLPKQFGEQPVYRLSRR